MKKFGTTLKINYEDNTAKALIGKRLVITLVICIQNNLKEDQN